MYKNHKRSINSRREPGREWFLDGSGTRKTFLIEMKRVSKRKMGRWCALWFFLMILAALSVSESFHKRNFHTGRRRWKRVKGTGRVSGLFVLNEQDIGFYGF